VIGPTIISSFSRSAFGNSVTAGIGWHVAATEDLVDEHLGHPLGRLLVLWSLSVSITSARSTSCILACTSAFSSSTSPSRMKSAMLSLAWKRQPAATSR
jgi:hypothetical protein